jgi:HD-GYP domain-containing protein (c-di-GMP phosphodiesterase class II)
VRNRELITAFTNTAALALQNVWMYEQLEKGYMDLALTLADVINARDTHIKVMPQRVAEWAQHTAQLLGLSEDDQDAIRWAALLHDIGKVEVPEKVLQKPEPLKPEEWKLLHHYPVKSERLVSPLTRFKDVGSILRSIRERFDGKGYPNKLQGEDIPLSARILSVADAYGSMIDERPYRQARSHEEAVQEIMNNSGKQFDPVVVNAFLQTVNHGEAIH